MSSDAIQKADRAKRDALERFAVIQAFYQVLAEQVDAKAGNNARADAEAILWDAYDMSGGDRVRLEVCGENVGALSMMFAAEHAEVRDVSAYDAWLVASGNGEIGFELNPEKIPEDELAALEDAHPEWFDACVSGGAATLKRLQKAPSLAPGGELHEAYDPDSGEIVPGVVFAAGHPKGTRLSGFKPEKVFNALQSHGVSLQAAALDALMPPAEGGE